MMMRFCIRKATITGCSYPQKTHLRKGYIDRTGGIFCHFRSFRFLVRERLRLLNLFPNRYDCCADTYLFRLFFRLGQFECLPGFSPTVSWPFWARPTRTLHRCAGEYAWVSGYLFYPLVLPFYDGVVTIPNLFRRVYVSFDWLQHRDQDHKYIQQTDVSSFSLSSFYHHPRPRLLPLLPQPLRGQRRLL
jgi:hypothetical protein